MGSVTIASHIVDIGNGWPSSSGASNMSGGGARMGCGRGRWAQGGSGGGGGDEKVGVQTCLII